MQGKKSSASKKLRNVDAVKQMLDGTHKSQTKKSLGWVPKIDSRRREIGEKWIDEDGRTWEQKDGYRVKHGKLDWLREELYGNKTCPKCNNSMTKRLDKKYFGIYKMCMDCSIEFETQLRVEGKWEDFQKQKIKSNIDSFVKDVAVEKEDLKKTLGKEKLEYVNSDGSLEYWDNPYTSDQIHKAVDEYYEKLKERLYVNNDIEYNIKTG